MKQLLAIALNDLKIEFADRSTWFSFLILPLIFTAVIGAATGGNRDPNADRRYVVAVVMHDTGLVATQLNAALAQSGVMRPEAYADEADALQKLKDEAVSAVIVVPTGFSTAVLAGQTAEVALHSQQADNTTLAIQEALQAATAQVSRVTLAALFSVEEAEKLRAFADSAERDAYFTAALAAAEKSAAETPLKVETKQAAASQTNAIPQGFTQSSPGQLVTWVLGTLLAGASALVAERTMGTLRRLLTMPAPRWSLLGGKILGRFSMGLLQMVVMVVAGMLFFQVRWGNSPLALAMVAVCFGLAATAFGLLLSTISRTEGQAAGLGSMGTFLMAPLGGAWFPIDITPPAFQQFAQIFPTFWAMRGFTDVVVRGQGPDGVLAECAVLVGFAAVFFGVGVWRFKYE